MGPCSMLSDVYITLGDRNTHSVLLQSHYLCQWRSHSDIRGKSTKVRSHQYKAQKIVSFYLNYSSNMLKKETLTEKSGY